MFIELLALVRRRANVDHARRRLHGFGFAVQLVAETLDVVHPIGDDEGVLGKVSLDSRREGSAGIFLCPRGGIVDIPGKGKGIVGDVNSFQLFDACIPGIC